MLNWMYNSLCNFGYWGISKLVVWLLWIKYYSKEVYYGKHIEHVNGETFNVNIKKTQLYHFENNTVNIVNGVNNLDVSQLLLNKGDVEWKEIVNIDSEKGDKVLRVDFTIDDKMYRIFYSYMDRWEYPISFPPYSNRELETEWKNKDYKHSVLVAEIDGKDVTDDVNMCLGPMGNMFKGRTCPLKAQWFGGKVLSIIDNEGNDYEFKDSERIVFH